MNKGLQLPGFREEKAMAAPGFFWGGESERTIPWELTLLGKSPDVAGFGTFLEGLLASRWKEKRDEGISS